jgi:hypothetical protein
LQKEGHKNASRSHEVIGEAEKLKEKYTRNDDLIVTPITVQRPMKKSMKCFRAVFCNSHRRRLLAFSMAGAPLVVGYRSRKLFFGLFVNLVLIHN